MNKFFPFSHRTPVLRQVLTAHGVPALAHRRSLRIQPCASRVILVVACLVVAGCGSPGGLETEQVRGVVTLDGAPLQGGGTVLFEPEGKGKMAVGQIEADGTFVLTTYRQGDGAIVGRHRVAVTPLIGQISDKAPARPEAPSAIPRKYQATASSGLVVDVAPGKVNECRLELLAE